MSRDDARRILSPSQLNTLARDLLEGSFPSVLVEGELGNLSRPGSGHLYFTLKDARAQVRCALFKPKSQWLNFVPREGLHVLARGRLTLYEARGDYQLILDSLEEAGEGALRRAFEELKQKLTAEGLFETERKRPLPAFVRRLAVVTSPSGAAVRDVLSVLARRFPLMQVDVLPVPVQGEGGAGADRRDAATRVSIGTLRRDPARARRRLARRPVGLQRRTPRACDRAIPRAGGLRDRARDRLQPQRFRRRRARADAVGRRRIAGAEPPRSRAAPAGPATPLRRD